MRPRLARLGDAMLSRILPEEEAGACITIAYTNCKCGSPCGETWCTQYVLNCAGRCVSTGGRC
jgi:hypothetical protein